MPLVVVEIDEHAAPAALSAAMVQACSSSFAQGTCTLSDPGDEAPVAVATVKWTDAGERRVEIEVGTRRRGEAQWLSKTLHFRAVDPRAERWRSVGLTIATLVRELAPASEPVKEAAAEPTTGAVPGGSETPSTTAPDAAETSVPGEKGSGPDAPAATPGRPSSEDTGADAPPDDVPPRGSRRSPRTALWLDLGPRGGRAFADGGIRAGGFVALALYPLPSPIFARVAVGHEVVVSGPADLSATFSSVTLGGGTALRLRDTALVLEPRAAFVIERLGVSLTDDRGRTDGSSLWGAAAQAGAALVWELGWVAPLLGADALWRGEPVDIAKTNQVLATAPAVDWSVQAAFRMFL